ncbi:MAG: MBL fold metallo-hydrolase [Chloroflexi bacterium]|jgi:ribonuclease Z|nr:MBL fold metallo-hydrolase [Chloroflexota bacterium]
MIKIIILGSANSIADAQHENTHLAIQEDNAFILVDCVGTPIVRLEQAGLDFNQLHNLILTHSHPDHISGVPLLLMNMWLLGRKHPLNIFGLKETLTLIQNLMDAYEWSKWPNFFPVNFRVLPAEKMSLALETDELRIFTSPVKHLLPTLGLRVELKNSHKIFAYSCDTEPCAAVEELAAGVDMLIHEATGEALGHSSARQAGEIAQRAKANSLYLIHYNPRDENYLKLPQQARESFRGPVTLAEDFMEIEI